MALVSAVQIYFLIKADKTARTAANAAKQSADATKATLDHMRDTAERQLRAYIFQDGGSIEWGVTAENVILARVTLKNFGQTPAYKFRSWTRLEILNTHNPIFDRALARGESIIGPGAKRNSTPQNGPFTDEDLASIRRGEKSIFVWGRIDYIDAFGHPHHFEFYDVNGDEIAWRPASCPGWPIQPSARPYEAT